MDLKKTEVSGVTNSSATYALFTVLLALATPFSSAAANEDRWSLGYCAPPYPPRCAERPPHDQNARLLCEKEAENFVTAVFRYRTCLNNEIERAVIEANRVIKTLKCERDERFCYELPNERH
jgi:hypothetical protein